MFINRKKTKKNKPRQVLDDLKTKDKSSNSKAVRGNYVVVSFLLIM